MTKTKNSLSCHTCKCDNIDNYLVKTVVGRFFCNKCAEESTVECELCGKVEDIEEARGTVLGEACSNCFAEKFTICHDCGDAVRNRDVYNVGDDSFCVYCYDEFTRCDACGEPTRDTNEHDDEYYCSSCYSNIVKPVLPPMCDGGFLGTRCFAIELEFNSVLKDETNWIRVHDGSLSCERGEFISGPIRGVNAINNITTNCGKIKGKINSNCGFHIHLDMTQESEENVKKFVLTAVGMEDFIFSIVSKSRQDNRYCCKMKNTISNLISNPLDIFNYGEYVCEDDKKYKYDDTRYNWVNIHSFYYRGTIEIRCHQGTNNPEKILNWAELWLKTADWSMKQDISFIEKMCVKPEFADMVLDSIGLRSSTIQYLRSRQEKMSSSDSEEE